jgi:hypothetical protein
MKSTQYFLFVKQRPDREGIKEEWILEKPLVILQRQQDSLMDE